MKHWRIMVASRFRPGKLDLNGVTFAERRIVRKPTRILVSMDNTKQNMYIYIYIYIYTHVRFIQ